MNAVLAALALAFLSAAGGMLLYELARARAERPIFQGREIITLYWVTYLSLAVLGGTSGLAAILH